MALNPYEMRWEILQRAMDIQTERYKDSVQRWHDRLLHNQDPQKYPDYPSNDEMYALAEEMKTFCQYRIKRELIKWTLDNNRQMPNKQQV